MIDHMVVYTPDTIESNRIGGVRTVVVEKSQEEEEDEESKEESEMYQDM